MGAHGRPGVAHAVAVTTGLLTAGKDEEANEDTELDEPGGEHVRSAVALPAACLLHAHVGVAALVHARGNVELCRLVVDAAGV